MLPGADQPLITDTGRLSDWQAGDEDFYLNAACWTIRQYCGWHVAPSISETGVRRWFTGPGYMPSSADNLVMLRSTYVTSVDQVVIDDKTLVADEDYFWDAPKGWLRLRPMTWPKKRFALVDYTHGYPQIPPDLEVVIYEMVARAQELPASNATRVGTMAYDMTLNAAIGIALTEDQKTRISRYRLTNFGLPPS